MNHKSLKRLVPPLQAPVSLEQVKEHLKIETNAEDSLLNSLILAATEVIEGYLNRSLITQTWQLTYDQPPFESFIELSRAPIQSIEGVTSYDSSNQALLLEAEKYFLNNERLILNDGEAWPSNLRCHDGLEVVYVAGYGANPEDVPEAIRQAILYQIGAFYENSCCDDEITRLAKTLLAPYRIFPRCL